MIRSHGTTMGIVGDGIPAGSIAIAINTDTDTSTEAGPTTDIIEGIDMDTDMVIDTGIDRVTGDTVTMADTITTVGTCITGVVIW
jgi:hypothetical protein